MWAVPRRLHNFPWHSREVLCRRAEQISCCRALALRPASQPAGNRTTLGRREQKVAKQLLRKHQQKWSINLIPCSNTITPITGGRRVASVFERASKGKSFALIYLVILFFARAQLSDRNQRGCVSWCVFIDVPPRCRPLSLLLHVSITR